MFYVSCHAPHDPISRPKRREITVTPDAHRSEVIDGLQQAAQSRRPFVMPAVPADRLGRVLIALTSLADLARVDVSARVTPHATADLRARVTPHATADLRARVTFR